MPIIKPETFNPAKLGVTPVKKGDGLHNLTYEGATTDFQIRGVTVSRPKLGWYDKNKKEYVWDLAPPVDTNKVVLNVDIRNARLAGRPDAPANANDMLAIFNMVDGIEEFNWLKSKDAFIKMVGINKLPQPVTRGPFTCNSNIVGEPLSADPYYVDEKTQEQKLKPLNISFDVYLKKRANATDPIVVDSAAAWKITGWTVNPDDATIRKPILEKGSFETDVVGGCPGYVRFNTGSSSVYMNKLKVPLRLDETFMEPSTWGRRHNQDEAAAEATAANPNLQW